MEEGGGGQVGVGGASCARGGYTYNVTVAFTYRSTKKLFVTRSSDTTHARARRRLQNKPHPVMARGGNRCRKTKNLVAHVRAGAAGISFGRLSRFLSVIDVGRISCTGCRSSHKKPFRITFLNRIPVPAKTQHHPHPHAHPPNTWGSYYSTR